ncbi:conjugal transfer protein TraM [Sediminicola sp. YIK13]|uniref:conjugative transposon protein TraM n=1 Tax=Sediminicola sp. YIK13 TaxID=1453352 RepID=UPI0007210E66|nr:conjugative transposon protein TraM [Sediminicola sp. YIK13]ALM08823.1 conjugal transfer protein TraM [Sediminicola sp. YIK13]
MNIEKNKIVFGSVILVVILFILSYTYLVLGEGDDQNDVLQETQVPKLEQQQKDYSSKLYALNELKEVRQTNAPSIYDEKLFDSIGAFDYNLVKKKRERELDSIYGKYTDRETERAGRQTYETREKTEQDIPKQEWNPTVSLKEIGLEHQLFFSANPQPIEDGSSGSTSSVLFAKVDGEQILKANSRIQLQLTQKVLIGTTLFPVNTKVYGIVTFQPNRVMIKIENIDHVPLTFKAYDLQDGLEGVYIENSFKSDASREVADDIVQDINLPGVPQVGGITKVFQRNNRTVKVLVADNYQLLLKSQ